MLNAREDHVEDFAGFTYERLFQKNGLYLGLAVQRSVFYLKEVKRNTKVIITSKIIEMSDRVSKVEIIMKNEKNRFSKCSTLDYVIGF